MKLKSILYIIGISALGFIACTDLEETVYDVVPTNQYGSTPEELKTITGGVYSSLRGYHGNDNEGVHAFPTCEFVFFFQEVVSDEAVIPARGGVDWLDGGRWIDAQRHEIDANSAIPKSVWSYCFRGISQCNTLLDAIKGGDLSEEDEAVALAEGRGLRAYYYYNLLNTFGNVPIVTSALDTGAVATSSRADVYAFVESELLEILPYLNEDKVYGFFTQDVCNTLLARLYINSEVFIGQARWQDCIDACDRVTNYTLESTVKGNFITENQGSNEIIFAIPYDNVEGTVGNYLASMTLNNYNGPAFSAGGAYQWCANGICAEPGVLSSFENGDERINSLLFGQQYKYGTEEPLTCEGGILLDYTEDVDDLENANRACGARLFKYELVPDETWERDHDWVLMRYAEIMLMKAECLVRLGDAASAYPIVSQLRERSGLTSTPNPVTLELIDQEWLHEFVFEGLRRTVNIRFGTYFEPGFSRPNTTPEWRALLPVPQTELDKNPKLVQNPGY